MVLLFKSGQLLLMRSKHCDYSVVTMSIIGKAVSFSVLLQTLYNLQYSQFSKTCNRGLLLHCYYRPQSKDCPIMWLPVLLSLLQVLLN